ncbi:putative spermidine/putrescine transport system substrate-binding protein [Curtobacterium luteum]|uniref:ABC transporter substrate-binding protein n=1 Tax=Curtobacterium luteum TaxID=33881 RepID=A0A8H9GCW8_9MICO|nr:MULTISPECIES: extracellular solute-binding protein [Curtobacterium]MBM7800850.1 putative spermidine/putrescine transport system substrate-binding protein [Curtobacterium luteum]NUU51141.1 extracellular solute-binding protein [Curtobacterium luteum]GGL11820.1 ABC transporter substrate-binding protein [Curtobacterium luteum]
MKTRVLAGLAIAAAATVALSGCVQSANAANSAADGKTALTVFISGDTNVQDLWEKSLIPAFEKAHPKITVRTSIDLHGEHDAQTQANLATAVKAGKSVAYDLVDAGFVTTAGKAGLMAKVDEQGIPNLADVPEATRQQGGDSAIPYRASSVLLAYDPKKVSDPPKTLDDLLAWIEANPGEFAYNSPSSGGSGGSFVATVLAKYLSADEQTTMQTTYDKSLESKWDKGFQVLKDLGPSTYQKGVYPNGNDQVVQLLGSGQIAMAPVWSDQFITSQKTGIIPKSIKAVQITDPSFTGSASFLGIPETEPAAKKAAAEELADFVLSSQGQQLVATAVSGYPVVPLDTLPGSVAEQFADANPSQLRLGFQSDFAADMNAAWDAKVPQ